MKKCMFLIVKWFPFCKKLVRLKKVYPHFDTDTPPPPPLSTFHQLMHILRARKWAFVSQSKTTFFPPLTGAHFSMDNIHTCPLHTHPSNHTFSLTTQRLKENGYPLRLVEDKAMKEGMGRLENQAMPSLRDVVHAWWTVVYIYYITAAGNSSSSQLGNSCQGNRYGTLIKKKIKFSTYIRKFRVEQLQSHIWLTASLYMGKYLRIFFLPPHFLGSPSSYMTLKLLHSEFSYIWGNFYFLLWARQSRTKLHLPGHSRPASQVGRCVGPVL